RAHLSRPDLQGVARRQGPRRDRARGASAQAVRGRSPDRLPVGERDLRGRDRQLAGPENDPASPPQEGAPPLRPARPLPETRAMNASSRPSPRFRGVFPVVPTIFDERGGLDLAGQKRCVDFMIDAGSQGLAILANFSEQFVLGDDERELLTRAILEHVAGRVPVIVTTTHFSTAICLARSQRAQAQGAAMVMTMPPYHGATL